MNQERLLKVLLSPYVSEKTTMAAEKSNQVAFKVLTDATKVEIREAVQNLFKVEVESVQVINVKGKTKRRGRLIGKRSDWKKAYVTLKAGQDIDFAAVG